jgi:hypothetical protein
MAALSMGRIFEIIREQKLEALQQMKIDHAMAFQREVTVCGSANSDINDFTSKAHGLDYASEAIDKILEKLEGGME